MHEGVPKRQLSLGQRLQKGAQILAALAPLAHTPEAYGALIPDDVSNSERTTTLNERANARYVYEAERMLQASLLQANLIMRHARELAKLQSAPLSVGERHVFDRIRPLAERYLMLRELYRHLLHRPKEHHDAPLEFDSLPSRLLEVAQQFHTASETLGTHSPRTREQLRVRALIESTLKMDTMSTIDDYWSVLIPNTEGAPRTIDEFDTFEQAVTQFAGHLEAAFSRVRIEQADAATPPIEKWRPEERVRVQELGWEIIGILARVYKPAPSIENFFLTLRTARPDSLSATDMQELTKKITELLNTEDEALRQGLEEIMRIMRAREVGTVDEFAVSQ